MFDSVLNLSKKAYGKAKDKYAENKKKNEELEIAEKNYTALKSYIKYLDEEIKKLINAYQKDKNKNYKGMIGLDLNQIIEIAIGREEEAERIAKIERYEYVKARCQKIKEFYDDKSNAIVFNSGMVTKLIGAEKIYSETVKQISSYSMDTSSAHNTGAMIGQNIRVASFRSSYKNVLISDASGEGTFTYQRHLSDMSPRELTVLKLIEIYRCIIDDDSAELQNYISIIFNKEKCSIYRKKDPSSLAEKHAYNVIFDYVKNSTIDPQTSCSKMISEFVGISEEHPDDLFSSYIRDELVGGNRLFKSSDRGSKKIDLEESRYTPDNRLLLGVLDSEYCVYYKGEGSLLTIANPGAGKTQSNVLPNLLAYDGPAIVLDIKGTCYEKSADWRRENVGPVYRFAPFDNTNSCQTNPLSYVRKDPKYIWDDSKAIADMLLIPQSNLDQTWERKAKDFIASTIATLTLDPEFENPNMQDLLDVLCMSGEELDEFLFKLSGEHDLFDAPRSMTRSAKNFVSLPEKQLITIKDTAMEHLSSWQSYEVEQVTQDNDLDPSMFRDGSNSTLYICMPQDKVAEHASLLRVILGNIVNTLFKEVPDEDSKSVVFFLDELPQLGRMAIIDKALELGREYGIRLWMFAQNKKQLAKVSDNPEGLIENTDVNIYMKPSYETAEELSNKLGKTTGIVDGLQKPLVETTDLVSGKFKEHATVLIRGEKPMILKKLMAYEFND
ncbi:type IV secretory system conjugative DNA transfer family protein [Vibrio parahaemolyticus]|uniref:type IV secretory system conjugative DNA transfer family protein n=3 Tax=Vibrio parahaemolyticus TaxID=670 RepID=UPI0009F0EAFB|nr:type IV secretory system conjugative DNA transfer family protein [Vibrio parahaemolyticus]EJG0620676.1 type IV secretory system conjugative DNA transfer family protein [Vibrio parahaemolyticus]EJG0638754.1 type IV secretory system conjugative DNA transfer family protein [Vibrio parahaemolyticus]EJG0686152.1 type IV secretory system conjugative DNA transfer family protein [Vibrio parahaemolyticus]EJG0701758.1 type IV secretory system conjugative DNA transfer family protein [Vibrio parahaemoly